MAQKPMAKKRDAARTREQLLEAATQVFAETGYAGATTRAIAERARVNEITLFRHFGAKADLLVAALAAEAAWFLPEAIRYSGDLEQDLIRLVRAYAEFARAKAPFIATVLSELPRFPELAAAAEVPRRLFAAAAAVITRYQQSGALHAEPPLVVAASLLAPLLMLALGRRAAPDVVNVQIDAADYVRRFLSGHAPARAARRQRTPAPRKAQRAR